LVYRYIRRSNADKNKDTRPGIERSASDFTDSVLVGEATVVLLADGKLEFETPVAFTASRHLKATKEIDP
jgi:hypothetical protein